MASDTIEKLRPRTDISSRTMLARLEEKLDGTEARMVDQFTQLNHAHGRFADRLEDIAATVVETQVAVARIEGEREAEHRGAALRLGSGSKYKAWRVAGGIIAAILGIPSAIVAAWQVIAAIYHGTPAPHG